MKLKIKRLPNIHCSRIQEREGAFDEKNRKPITASASIKSQGHIRSSQILPPGQPWML